MSSTDNGAEQREQSSGRGGVPERVNIMMESTPTASTRTTSGAPGTTGSSQRSLGGSSLPAPETTRPRQLSSRSLISNNSLRSLTSMGSTSVVGPHHQEDELEETRRIAEELQEEEMLRLAMEQSLSESGFQNILHTDAFSPMRKSNRSITSVRSAPGDPTMLQQQPRPTLPQSLVQSFRLPPPTHQQRPRRRPAPQTTPLQPDYEDDMFDLSPRDEDEEETSSSSHRMPGAISMPTPPPDLRLLQPQEAGGASTDAAGGGGIRKSSAVRAAIESFVERGIAAPPLMAAAAAGSDAPSTSMADGGDPRTSGMREPVIANGGGRTRRRSTNTTAAAAVPSTTTPRTPDRRRQFAERDGLEKHASLRRAQEMIARCEAAAGPLRNSTGGGGGTSERSLEREGSSRRDVGGVAAVAAERSTEQQHHRGSRPHQEIMAMMAAANAATGRTDPNAGMPVQLRQQYAAERGRPSSERSIEATRREEHSRRHHPQQHQHHQQPPDDAVASEERVSVPVPVRPQQEHQQQSRGQPSSSERSLRIDQYEHDRVPSERALETSQRESFSGSTTTRASPDKSDQRRSWRSNSKAKEPKYSGTDGGGTSFRSAPLRAISGSGFFRRSDRRSVAARDDGATSNTPPPASAAAAAAATTTTSSPNKSLQSLGLDITKLKVDSQTSPVVVSDARLGRKSAWRRLESSSSSANPSTSSWPALGQEAPPPPPAATRAAPQEPSYDFAGAEEHLSPEELQQIQMALQASTLVAAPVADQQDAEPKKHHHPHHHIGGGSSFDGIEDMDMMGALTDDEEDFGEPMYPPTTRHAAASTQDNDYRTPEAPLSEEESAAIMQAVLRAEQENERQRAEDEQKSLQAIALLMQEEEANTNSNNNPHAHQERHGNVRTMTRAEYDAQQFAAQVRSSDAHRPDDGGYDDFVEEGYRMNSSAPQRWARRDQYSVMGPNREIRTKHDAALNSQSNAHRLGLEENFASVSNRAFNSFKQSMKLSKKGVATAGSGRAGSDATGTRSGGLDDNVRAIISKAVNNGVIERCNGVVNEGKEAVIFHADEGMESDGFDVAIKVFKRIQEFKNRGDYVEGDPRYAKSSFTNANRREQLELWAEKEFRNLMRAHNADVPVPAPLLIKENVVFMRFLGHEWPAPQLKDLDIARGSKRWNALYDEILNAVRRLVHGDLSEYNVLVVPARYIHKTQENSEELSETEVRIVLIDLAQAVDTRHPSATELLHRDLETLLSFFARQGITVPSLSEAIAHVQTC